MKKINFIQSIFFSGLLLFLLITGLLYITGEKGEVINKIIDPKTGLVSSKVLSVEGKFGAGLITMFIIFFLWNFIISYGWFKKNWNISSKNKVFIISNIIVWPISIIMSLLQIFYFKEFNNSKIDKEGENV